jgi:hypothetical protein
MEIGKTDVGAGLRDEEYAGLPPTPAAECIEKIGTSRARMD